MRKLFHCLVCLQRGIVWKNLTKIVKEMVPRVMWIFQLSLGYTHAILVSPD